MNTNQLPPEFFDFLKEMPAVIAAVKQIPLLVEAVKPIPGLVKDMKELKQAVSQLQTDVTTLQTGFARQEAAIFDMRLDMLELKKRYSIALDQAALNSELRPQFSLLKNCLTQTIDGISEVLEESKSQLVSQSS